jgi:hypothetical protein
MITSDRLVIALIFVVIAVLACFAPAQGDTWWHLRAGQDIWRTHSVSLIDTYSYTAAGRLLPNYEWLTQAVFYAFYRLGGMPLLTASCAASIVFAWALAWRLAEGPFEVKLVALLMALATSTISWAIRPQAFSTAFLMVTVWLLASNRVRLLPLLFLVWANFHGSVALGLAAVAAALVAATIRERRVPVSLLLSALGCAVATCFTPLGLRYWPEILASVQRSRVNDLIEWSAPGFGPRFWPFWAMAAAVPIAAVALRRRLDARTATLVAVALVLLPLAVRSMRNVPMFMLVALPTISRLARPDTPPRDRKRSIRERTGVNAAILGVTGAVGAVIVALAWIAKAPVLGWQPLSAEAIRTISACPDPIYNTYEGGGALIWFVPQKKVFIDNRQDPYPADLLSTARQLETDGRYQSLFRQYGIRCVVIPAASPTAVGLGSDATWTQAYTDVRWAVFVRR